MAVLATQEFKISSQGELTQLNEALSADVISQKLKLGGLNLREGLEHDAVAFWMKYDEIISFSCKYISYIRYIYIHILIILIMSEHI